MYQATEKNHCPTSGPLICVKKTNTTKNPKQRHICTRKFRVKTWEWTRDDENSYDICI